MSDNLNNTGKILSEKKLLIGLDLSFNSTGISLSILDENDCGEKLIFFRVLFDKESNVTGKVYSPEKLPNINNVIYRMPTNISPYDLILDADNENNIEQMESTIRAMICSKKICSQILPYINFVNPCAVIVTIENYIMPSFTGKNQLKLVSGLILLQGFVREFFIRTKILMEFDLKIFTPTATENKKFFTDNGKAEKIDMINAFFTQYDGEKLIKKGSEKQLNDVIDSFSLMLFGYLKYLQSLGLY